MRTRNVNLTREMDQYVASKIESGQYANESGVLRAGLRVLERSEREDQVRLEALRAAVLAGEESGVAEGDVLSEFRERILRRALVTRTVWPLSVELDFYWVTLPTMGKGQ